MLQNFSILILKFFLISFIINVNLLAQDSLSLELNEAFYIINSIDIEGNKKTKNRTILRELSFEVADTLNTEELTTLLETNRNQVYNLGLFNEVEIVLDAVDKEEIDLKIVVAERWYWLAFPIFELADRNFNVWWRDFDRDFRRTKYGFNIEKNNVGGRNETFDLNFKWGYNRKIIFLYEIPFIDRKKIWGLNFNTYYFADREIAYGSFQNEAQFYTHSSFANSRIGAEVRVTRRADIKNTHAISARYFRNTIVDTLQTISPEFFNNESNRQQSFNIRYQYEHDARDIRIYPTKGWYVRTRIEKIGLGIFNDINRIAFEADVSKYTQIGTSQFVASNFKFHTSYGEAVPYNSNLRLGFLEHFVRGYEYYVIDAQHYLVLRNALKQRLFDIKFKGLSKINEQLKVIPIQIYLKAFNEVGWSRDRYFNENNPLNNALLAGYGVGLDLVTFYDNMFSFEYTFNREREHGFFLHINVTWDFY